MKNKSKHSKLYTRIGAVLLGIVCVVFSLIAISFTNAPMVNSMSTPDTYNETFDTDGSLYSSGNSLYDPVTYIESRYDVVSVTESVSYMLDNWSYSSQTLLNRIYNSNYNASVNGTCGVVACTSVVYYYATQKDYSNIPANKNTLFAKLIDYYGITGSEGTYSNTYKNAIPWLFSEYGYTISASRATAINKYTKMRTKAQAGILTVLATSGTERYKSHAMVVIGYKTYAITYTSGSKTKTTTETYYAVDEGWDTGKATYLMEGNMPGTWEITTIG